METGWAEPKMLFFISSPKKVSGMLRSTMYEARPFHGCPGSGLLYAAF